MEDTAIADVGLEAPGLDAVENSTADDFSTDSNIDPSAEESTADENVGEKSAPIAEVPAIVGGKLSEAAKATLDQIHKENPILARQLRQALFQTGAITQLFPGGVKELREIHQHLEQAGGVEGIQRVTSELEYFNGLDQAFTAGDPKFLAAMTGTPEGQAAFVKLAPAMFSKLGELHPESYSSLVAQAMVADLYNNRVPLDLERLQDLLGENPAALKVLERITGYMNRVNDWARKPVTAPTPKQGADDSGLRERELNITRTEWRGEADASAKGVYEKELATLTAGRKMSDTQRAAVVELYQSRVRTLLGKIPGFTETAKRFFDSGNKDGYLRHVNATYAKVIPQALKQAMDTIVPGKPGPKPGAVAQPKTNTGIPPKAEAGFTFVAQRPSPLDLDKDRNTAELISQGKAILKDGRKVMWRR